MFEEKLQDRKKGVTSKMKTIVNCITVLIAILIIAPGLSFAIERPLNTLEATAADITGTYTLILYGRGFSDDLETIAILDKEGDQYTFEPYAPDFDYILKHQVKAKDALKEAENFISFHYSFWKLQLSRIIDKKGNTIAYEARPLYLPFTFGVSDVLEVSYWFKESGRVKILIRLIPSIERTRFPGGADAGVGGN
ncbi:MAG: hypothetical protein A2Y97_05265 [Nitrospirae bacterium RBG_13_39_12]|nr:MAG: hypothetical protein A2Y97_05265 [Nitrospirae bacterium RBG_13_39_12]